MSTQLSATMNPPSWRTITCVWLHELLAGGVAQRTCEHVICAADTRLTGESIASQSAGNARWYNAISRVKSAEAPSGRQLLATMTEPRTITYADAGVDIERANRTKQRIKYLAHKTFNRGVLSDIGGFGGLFSIDKKKYPDPVLVSSVDGVGTKLKIAFEMKLHHTIGADLVNHCVNDVVVQGAAPMFFLDYFATGKLH